MVGVALLPSTYFSCSRYLNELLNDKSNPTAALHPDFWCIRSELGQGTLNTSVHVLLAKQKLSKLAS